MLTYDMAGKQAILVLDPKFLKPLKPLGILGSPVYGTVHAVEDKGIWMENRAFPLCPLDQPRLKDATGGAFCHAHVFIPEQAVISIAVFPQKVEEPEEGTGLSRIGFVK